MKNFVYSLLAIVAAALVFSCAKNTEMELVNVTSSHVEYRTFTCTLATSQPDSKVNIDSATGKTEWEENDEILVHGEYIGENSGKKYSTIVSLKAADISPDKKTATITVPIDETGVDGIIPYIHKDGDVQDYASTLYAVYPASAVKGGNYHTYYYSVFTDFSEPIVAGYNDGDSFIFYNIGSMITFSIANTEDFDSYIFAGNAEGETVGYDQFSVRVGKKVDDEEKYDVPYSSTSSSYGTIGAKSSITGSVKCDGTTQTIFIPGGVTLSKGFILYFLKGGVVKKVAGTQGTKAIDLSISDTRKGKILPLGDITDKLKAYVAPTTHNSSISKTGAVDLSATESANCYLLDSKVGVAADKVYTFKAYQGNKPINVGTVYSAGVIWETNNGENSVASGSVIAQVDYDKQDGDDFTTIVFKMPASIKAGNAAIAAYDGPLCTGNILWSWHIWIPSTDVDAQNYGIVAESKMMDRNLGALQVATANESGFIDVTSIGMVYQWGRKDPFLGPDKIKKDSYRSWATYVGSKAFTTSATQLSLEESIKNPTLLATGTSSNPNWLSPYDKDLWGDAAEKSKYDPCPPGYRVPQYDTDYSLWSEEDITAATGWSTSQTNFWFTLGSPATVFPCSGYRSGSDFKTSYRTIIWSAHASSYQGSKDEPYYSGYSRYITTSSATSESMYNNIGAAVRCVIDE